MGKNVVAKYGSHDGSGGEERDKRGGEVGEGEEKRVGDHQGERVGERLPERAEQGHLYHTVRVTRLTSSRNLVEFLGNPKKS